MKKLKVGFALCGSFCTLDKAIEQMKRLVELNYDVLPIMSEAVYNTDTRFGKASDFKNKVETVCSKKIIHTITMAEPIGPQNMTDIMIIAPCTGNTLSKLEGAITDTSVTMAAKAHLRGQKPLVVALATNDALGASAKNLGNMLNIKNIYFVPMAQDDPDKKPNSLVANFELIPDAIEAAFNARQLRPIILE
ncbi:MAG: Dipicolinate synthase subunit B [Eubacteriales bacterium SKADARSKE-1]|nr:Dipicolinate synthase subunit B [Eubacteriales bacterium SKADARSKE-1]